MNKLKLIVADSSCIILFHQLKRLDLLIDICDSIGGILVLLTPVLDELYSIPDNALESLTHKKIAIDDFQQYQYKFHVGKGEASILKYGERSEIIAILDDLRARKIAVNMGINVKGTMGLLGAGFVLCPIATKKELIGHFSKASKLGFRLPQVDSFINTLQKK